MNPNRKRPSEEGHSEGSPAKLRKEGKKSRVFLVDFCVT